MAVTHINDHQNKERVAICVVGYNRIGSMSRLLQSLLKAKYPPNVNIPLIISIDCSGNEELYQYAHDFNWPFGDKHVFIQEKRLGLKNHIFKCIALSEFFKAVVLLEDDLSVSPYFYDYADKAVDKYGKDPRIAEIALYKNETNGYASFPFNPIDDGNDVFLWQDVCTWGEIFTFDMWKRFNDWHSNICTDKIIDDSDMPYQIKTWTRAWSKPYNAFVANTNSYVVYPKISLVTNYGDAGEHSSNAVASMVQVSILHGDKNYFLPDVDKLTRYDFFCNNEDLYSWLDLDKDNLCLDIYGMGRAPRDKRYILSPKQLPFSIVKSFSLLTKPIETNIYYNNVGKGMYLYDTTKPTGRRRKNIYPFAFNYYYLNIFDNHNIWQYAKTTFLSAIKRKLHI